MNKGVEVLITDEQIRESERIRKFLEDLRPKQKKGYYSDLRILGYYDLIRNFSRFK